VVAGDNVYLSGGAPTFNSPNIASYNISTGFAWTTSSLEGTDKGNYTLTYVKTPTNVEITKANQPALYINGGNRSMSMEETVTLTTNATDGLGWASSVTGVATIAGGGAVTPVAPGVTTITVTRTVANYNSATATITLTVKERTPVPGIDYVNEKLTGLVSGNHTVNGAASNVPADGTVSIQNGWFGITVPVIKTNATAAYNSKTASIYIPARPVAPSSPMPVHATSGNNGKITGVNSTMEYSTDGTTWVSIGGGEITGLAAGTYYVRYRAVANTSFHSDYKRVTIGNNTQTGSIRMSVGEIPSFTYGADVTGVRLNITISNTSDTTVVKGLEVSSSGSGISIINENY
jgi:hypothetical protein